MNCYRLAVGVFVIIVISVVVGYGLYAAPPQHLETAKRLGDFDRAILANVRQLVEEEGEFFVFTLSVMKLFGATHLSFIKPLRARSWGAWGGV